MQYESYMHVLLLFQQTVSSLAAHCAPDRLDEFIDVISSHLQPMFMQIRKGMSEEDGLQYYALVSGFSSCAVHTLPVLVTFQSHQRVLTFTCWIVKIEASPTVHPQLLSSNPDQLTSAVHEK